MLGRLPWIPVGKAQGRLPRHEQASREFCGTGTGSHRCRTTCCSSTCEPRTACKGGGGEMETATGMLGPTLKTEKRLEMGTVLSRA